MIPLTLDEVAEAVGGRLLGDMTVPSIGSVSTDSRAIGDRTLFVAIRGERFDGHDFVNGAMEAGAVAALVSDPGKVDARYHEGGRLILVRDTVDALGKLGGWYRRQLGASVIAVVGSNGKTTTKGLIASVLNTRKRGRASPASYNNAIGVPLTLLSVDGADDFVVVEIGTNHPGEIAALARLAKPNIVVITSIAEEHLEYFGDVETVAKEELSILAQVKPGSLVVIHHEAATFAASTLLAQHTVLTYGTLNTADLRATDIRATDDGQRFKVNGRREYDVRLLGRHNVENALAAIAVGTRMRLSEDDIAKGLENAKAPPMRLEQVSMEGIRLINDAYNANPGSMKAAFDVLDQLPHSGRKVLILGDMLELGEQSESCHQLVGREAGRSTANVILAVGRYARVVADGAASAAGMSKRIYAYPDTDALCAKLASVIEPGDAVLMKASRGVKLERILEPMSDAARAAAVK